MNRPDRLISELPLDVQARIAVIEGVASMSTAMVESAREAARQPSIANQRDLVALSILTRPEARQTEWVRG